MSYSLKKQDALGIFSSIGITAIVLSVVLATGIYSGGVPASETDGLEIIGIGGITEVKESISISFDSQTVDLDTSDGLFRANLVYEGFQPQMGRVLLEVYTPNGEKMKESELQLRQRGNDVYEADFTQHFDKNEFDDSMLGQYIMRVSTDHGTLAKQTPFKITKSSLEQPRQVLAVESNIVSSNIGGVLSDKPSAGYDFGTMEADLENTIIKKYLSKILKEYYDGDISKDEIKKLTEFKNIECDLVSQKSQTGDSLNLSCEMKADE